MPTRRDLLLTLGAALPLGWPPPPPAWMLMPVPNERAVLIESAGPTRISLPARRCRLLASFHLAGRPRAAVRFAAATSTTDEIDLLAVAGDGRILALEPWTCVGSDGAHLSSRFDLLPQQHGLLLHRMLARPNAARTAWRRESWTDLLVADGAALIDSPVRPPLPDTAQAAMAQRRADILRRLQRPTAAMDDALAALVAAKP